jgi:excisionase family DNA binding protein
VEKYPTLSQLAGRRPADEALVRQATVEIGQTSDPARRKLLSSYFEMLCSADRAASDAGVAILHLLGDTETAKPEHLPNAYSPRTLARRWLCSERHVVNMIKRGELPYNRLGGKLYRIRRSDVEEYERRNAVTPL